MHFFLMTSFKANAMWSISADLVSIDVNQLLVETFGEISRALEFGHHYNKANDL